MNKQEAAEWLRKQPVDAMPSVGTFMRECDLSLQDAVEVISEHSDLGTRVTREADPGELPQPTTKLSEIFPNVTPNDLHDAYRYSFMSQLMPAIVMAYRLMEAADENSIRVSAPVDLGVVDICEWPNPYCTLEMRKVNGAIKFQLDGEWRL